MSKKINVNPDHYKTAGRERQGDSLTQDIHKQQFGRSRAGSRGAKMLPGDTRKNKTETPRRSKRT